MIFCARKVCPAEAAKPRRRTRSLRFGFTAAAALVLLSATTWTRVVATDFRNAFAPRTSTSTAAPVEPARRERRACPIWRRRRDRSGRRRRHGSRPATVTTGSNSREDGRDRQPPPKVAIVAELYLRRYHKEARLLTRLAGEGVGAAWRCVQLQLELRRCLT